MIILSGVWAGLLVSIPPGPVSFEIIRKSLTGHAKEAIAFGLGVVMVDIGYMALATWGVAGLLLSTALLRVLLYITGGMIMFRFAYRSWESRSSSRTISGHGETTGLREGIGIALFNPGTIMICISLAGMLSAKLDGTWFGVFVMAVGVGIGSLVWKLILTGSMAYLGRYMNERIYRILSIVGIVVFTYFGIRLFYSALEVSAWILK